MANWEFPGSDPIDVHIDLASGSIAIAAEQTEVTTVTLLPSRSGRDADDLIADARVDYDDGRLTITGPKHTGLRRRHSSLDLTVRVPALSRCTVRTASADVSCVGKLGSLDARTASGDVTAKVVDGAAQLATASGDVWLEAADQGLSVNTASGDVRLLRAAGHIAINTASGDIQVGIVNGAVQARTASGDVQIDTLENGGADVNSISGDVAIGVVPGAGVYLDLSSVTGRVASDLEPSDADGQADINVKCRTVSGDVHITRAVRSDAR